MYQLYSSISVLYLELVVLSDVYSIISINTTCWHAKNASFPNKAFKQANLSIGLTKVNTWSKASQSLVKIRWKTLPQKQTSYNQSPQIQEVSNQFEAIWAKGSPSLKVSMYTLQEKILTKFGGMQDQVTGYYIQRNVPPNFGGCGCLQRKREKS